MRPIVSFAAALFVVLSSLACGGSPGPSAPIEQPAAIAPAQVKPAPIQAPRQQFVDYGPRGPKDVQVHDYTRKDGTHVKAHVRSAPRH